MTLAHDLPRPAGPGSIDQFVYLHGVSFLEYEAVQKMRGERSVPRITYLRGELELMTPSRYHENDKKRFARLLEAWAEETGTELEGVGSWTLKNSQEERGAEPDECYTVGRVPASDDDRPDLAIEVIWTGGGINKLEVYRKLAVREVWFYERPASENPKGCGTLRFFVLPAEQYEPVTRSEILPGCGARAVHALHGRAEAGRGRPGSPSQPARRLRGGRTLPARGESLGLRLFGRRLGRIVA